MGITDWLLLDNGQNGVLDAFGMSTPFIMSWVAQATRHNPAVMNTTRGENPGDGKGVRRAAVVVTSKPTWTES